jgi:hypothetical protein
MHPPTPDALRCLCNYQTPVVVLQRNVDEVIVLYSF